MAAVINPLEKKLPTEGIQPIGSSPTLTGPGAVVTPSTPVKQTPSPITGPGSVITAPKPIGASTQPITGAGSISGSQQPIGSSNITPVTTPVGAIAPTTSAPDYNAPHIQGDIWDPSRNAWTLPGTPAAQTPVSNVKKVDTSGLTPEQLSVYNANQKHFDSINTLSGMSDVITKLGEEARTGAETKYAKDIGEAQSDIQKQSELQKQAASIQSAQQLDAAKTALAKSVNNANYLRGATGFAQTQAALNAQSGQLDRARKLVDDISALNNISAQADADGVAVKMRELQEDLDSNVSQSVQKQMANLGLLIQSGKLDSVEAINKARSDLKETLSSEYNQFLQKNFEASKFVLQQAEKRLEEARKDTTFSKDFTQQVNDGFIYNAAGKKMVDSAGQPLKGSQMKPIEQSIDNKDGTYSILYKDGTFETIKAGQDTSKIPSKETTELLGPSTGFVYNAQGNIITDAKGKPMKYTPEPQKGQVVTLKDADGVDHAYIFDGKTITSVGAPSVSTPTPSSSGITKPAGATNPSDFIKAKEGFRDKAYWDVNGWAVGYGQHSIGGKPVTEGQTITREQADADFASRKFRYEDMIEVPLSESQRAALASFEWNLGGGIWKGDAKPVIDKINAGDFAGAADYMKQFVYADGKVNNGLAARRNEEAGLLTQAPAAGESNQYTGVAQDLIDGTIKASDLSNLGYKPTQVKQIEAERQRITKDQVMKPIQATPAMLPLFRSYVEDGKLPSAPQLKSFGMSAEQFADLADTGYNKFLDQKAKEISRVNPTFDIEYIPSQYSANSQTQKEALNNSMTKIADFDKRMSRLIELFKEKGTEILPTEAKKEMTTLREQLVLKGKEIENLGVLNGPDLGILESLLPKTNEVFSINSNTLKTLNTLQSQYRSDAESKAINYGAKLRFDNDGESGRDAITTSSGKTYNANDYQ